MTPTCAIPSDMRRLTSVAMLSIIPCRNMVRVTVVESICTTNECCSTCAATATDGGRPIHEPQQSVERARSSWHLLLPRQSVDTDWAELSVQLAPVNTPLPPWTTCSIEATNNHMWLLLASCNALLVRHSPCSGMFLTLITCICGSVLLGFPRDLYICSRKRLSALQERSAWIQATTATSVTGKA